MQTSAAKRFGELSKDEQVKLADPKGSAVEEHLNPHILTGVLEADGPVALATKAATLTADISSLSVTDSGGIAYQFIIYSEEPAPLPVLEAPVAKVLTPEEEAVAYLVGEGQSQKVAEGQVKRFGAARILKARDAKLDQELANVLSKPEAPKAKVPELPGA